MSDNPKLTEQHFGRALERSQRRRLMQGQIESGADVVALRRFVGHTQKDFARAFGISVYTLRNSEQGRQTPEGPALASLLVSQSPDGDVFGAGHLARWA